MKTAALGSLNRHGFCVLPCLKSKRKQAVCRPHFQEKKQYPHKSAKVDSESRLEFIFRIFATIDTTVLSFSSISVHWHRLCVFTRIQLVNALAHARTAKPIFRPRCTNAKFFFSAASPKIPSLGSIYRHKKPRKLCSCCKKVIINLFL